jgi:hypothetical protein
MQLESLKGSGTGSQCSESLEEFKSHALNNRGVDNLEAKVKTSGVEKAEVKDLGAG